MTKPIVTPQYRLVSKIEYALRMICPQMIILIFFLIGVVPGEVFKLIDLKLPLILSAIFYWSIFRPNVCPSWLIFSYGFVFDVFSGDILGFHAFVYLLIQFLVKSQRQILHSQSFFTLWGAFGIVNLTYFMIVYARLALLQSDMPDFIPYIIATLFLTFLYPALSPIFILTHKIISVRTD